MCQMPSLFLGDLVSRRMPVPVCGGPSVSALTSEVSCVDAASRGEGWPCHVTHTYDDVFTQYCACSLFLRSTRSKEHISPTNSAMAAPAAPTQVGIESLRSTEEGDDDDGDDDVFVDTSEVLALRAEVAELQEWQRSLEDLLAGIRSTPDLKPIAPTQAAIGYPLPSSIDEKTSRQAAFTVADRDEADDNQDDDVDASEALALRAEVAELKAWQRSMEMALSVGFLDTSAVMAALPQEPATTSPDDQARTPNLATAEGERPSTPPFLSLPAGGGSLCSGFLDTSAVMAALPQEPATTSPDDQARTPNLATAEGEQPTTPPSSLHVDVPAGGGCSLCSLGCMGGQDPVEIDPGDNTDDDPLELWPDVLRRTYIPPLPFIDPTNKWLPYLAPAQLVEIHTAFDLFDRDGDGHIAPSEIRSVMAGVGVDLGDDAEVRELIAAIDADGNGAVEFEEFLSIMASNIVRDGGSELEQALALFDPQRTGFVDVECARSLLTSIGEQPLSDEEVDDMVARMGKDPNGRIPMERLVGMAAWQPPPPAIRGGGAGAGDIMDADTIDRSTSPAGFIQGMGCLLAEEQAHHKRSQARSACGMAGWDSYELEELSVSL